MAGLGTFATTAIITKGLHCGPACRGLITTHFQLFCSVEVPPNFNNGKGGGGGPYPSNMGAWNQVDDIQNFYQPTKEQPFIVPPDKEAEYFRKNVNIHFKMKIQGIEVDKNYQVPQKLESTTIKVFNLIDATINRVGVSISNLKKITHTAIIKIRNLRVLK